MKSKKLQLATLGLLLTVTGEVKSMDLLQKAAEVKLGVKLTPVQVKEICKSTASGHDTLKVHEVSVGAKREGGPGMQAVAPKVTEFLDARAGVRGLPHSRISKAESRALSAEDYIVLSTAVKTVNLSGNADKDSEADLEAALVLSAAAYQAEQTRDPSVKGLHSALVDDIDVYFQAARHAHQEGVLKGNKNPMHAITAAAQAYERGVDFEDMDAATLTAGAALVARRLPADHPFAQAAVTYLENTLKVKPTAELVYATAHLLDPAGLDLANPDMEAVEIVAVVQKTGLKKPTKDNIDAYLFLTDGAPADLKKAKPTKEDILAVTFVNENLNMTLVNVNSAVELLQLGGEDLLSTKNIDGLQFVKDLHMDVTKANVVAAAYVVDEDGLDESLGADADRVQLIADVQATGIDEPSLEDIATFERLVNDDFAVTADQIAAVQKGHTPDVQNAITAYILEHDGEIPSAAGQIVARVRPGAPAAAGTPAVLPTYAVDFWGIGSTTPGQAVAARIRGNRFVAQLGADLADGQVILFDNLIEDNSNAVLVKIIGAFVPN